MLNTNSRTDWFDTKGAEILNRTKIIISQTDKDLVMSNLTRYDDIDKYEQSFNGMGQNWHSGGAIIGAKIKFANFSDESKSQLKRKFYDEIEYIMESNALAKNMYSSIKLPTYGITGTDDIVIECDDEWGLFIRIYRDGETNSYIDLKADDDPVSELLWGVDRRTLPLKTN